MWVFRAFGAARGNRNKNYSVRVKSEAIPVTGRGGPRGCEMLRITHSLDIRLTDCGAVVSLMGRPRFNHRNIFWYPFLLETE
jgi:hypothetical protein